MKEIQENRIAHGKKPLKDKKEDDDPKDPAKGVGNGSVPMKEQKQSTTDPESGWFHKGEHKSTVFRLPVT